MKVLRFPSLDALRLALTSGTIPDAVARARADAGFDPKGPVWVRPWVSVPWRAMTALRRLGVEAVAKEGVPLDEPVGCWPQLLPVTRDPDAGPPGDATAVLFELAEADLPALVGEILRLGNDRQGFRWIDDGGGPRALLRVIGPPYYSLLRALDRVDEHAPRAYIERAPRVFVEIGHAHPLAGQLRPDAGTALLLRAPRRWSAVAEAPFRDVYEVLEYHLPRPPSSWRPVEQPRRVRIPLRLGRGNVAHPAELWVLRDRADEQLDALVQGADDQLLARLAFAVAAGESGTTIVLRCRPSKLAPPVLVLDAEGYRPYLKIPNLFLPCGAALQPPLRRDAVVKLLAADPDRIAWLAPLADGAFQPEDLPDDAFRPLSQWVDYVLDREHRALAAWVAAARFDFEPFVCRDDRPAEVKPPPEEAPTSKPPRRDRAPAIEEETPKPVTLPDRRRLRKARNDDEPVDVPATEALQRHLQEREDHFLALDTPPDAEERQALWRELAEGYSELGRAGDTTVCWANALWELEDAPADDLRAWFEAERVRASRPLKTGAELDALLDEPHPTAGDVRSLFSYVAWASRDGDSAGVVSSRLDRVQPFLERTEGTVPARLAWLAWLGVATLSRGDVLALARARDRLLERLFQQGLSPDLDLPNFLRFAGGAGGDRARRIREQMFRLRSLSRRWVSEGMATAPRTGAFAELIFAYGLARLGDGVESRRLAGEAGAALKGRDVVSNWLFHAFDERIRRVLEGKPEGGPLPEEWLDALANIDGIPRSKIDRLRQHSEILEPHEKIDPYRLWRRHETPLDAELAGLADVRDPAELAGRLNRLMKGLGRDPQADWHEAAVVAKALDLAPRAGEAFARDVLARVAPTVARLTELRDQSRLLEKGLFLAAHYDLPGHFQALVALIHEQLEGRSGDKALDALEPILRQCSRGQRKLGKREEIGRLLERIAALVFDGRGVSLLADAEESQARRRGPWVGHWADTLNLLLHVAVGWLDLGQDARALPILDEARALLLDGELSGRPQTRFACAYVRTLGQAPIDLALPRLEELLRRLDRVHDAFTTNSHYSLSRLEVIEAVVLALVGDDLVLDRTGRRWLEDDEFLVRRRIHRDVRAALGRAD